MSDKAAVCQNCRRKGATTLHATKYVRLVGNISGTKHYMCDACHTAFVDECKHMNFAANVDVHRLLKNEGDETAHRYQADVKINCAAEWMMGFPRGWTDLEDSATP